MSTAQVSVHLSELKRVHCSSTESERDTSVFDKHASAKTPNRKEGALKMSAAECSLKTLTTPHSGELLQSNNNLTFKLLKTGKFLFHALALLVQQIARHAG